MADRKVELPPHADWLDELNPYAVDARYGLVAAAGLNRDRVIAATREVIKWARDLIE